MYEINLSHIKLKISISHCKCHQTDYSYPFVVFQI